MDLRTATDLCTYCPRLCSDRCPVSLVEARETVTPQAKMARLGALGRAHKDEAAPGLEGRGASPGLLGPWSPAAPLPLYACTGCGACSEACLHRVEPARHLLAGRASLEARHAGHPALRGLLGRHRAHVHAAAESVRNAIPEERRQADAPVAFLPACLAAPGETTADDALRMLRLQQRAPRLLGDAEDATLGISTAGCAGYPLYAAGLLDEFRLHAEVFARAVSGHRTLLVGCSGCAFLLRAEYAAHGVPIAPEVLPVSERLGQRAEALPARRRLPRAFYHDPCYLGRRLSVYDEPRAALGRAVGLLGEFAESRAAAGCCGGGGLLPLTAPKTAAGMAEERLRQLPEGTDTVVTACTSCQRQLARAGAARGVRVRGLLEVLDEATG